MRTCILLVLIIPLFSSAEVIYKKTEQPKSSYSSQKSLKVSIEKKAVTNRKQKIEHNLPDYAYIKNKQNFQIGSSTINGENNTQYILDNVFPGDEYEIILDTILYAIEGVLSPITGTIINGNLIGSRVIGHTELEPFSKKIIVNFTRLKTENAEEFVFSGKVSKNENVFLDPSKYISKKSQFLLKHVLAAFASSFLQSRVSTNQTIWNSNQIENDIKSSSYYAASQGVNVVAQEFSRALQSSKDVAYINNPSNFKLKIFDKPVFKNTDK